MRSPCVFVLVVVAASLAHAAPPTKDEIDAAKKEAVAYLMSIVQPNRAWEPPESDPLSAQQAWGVSGFVALSLVEAGEDPATNPALKKAVDQIAGGKTDGVYALGVRVQLLGHPIFKNKYKKQIRIDMESLKGGTKNGLFGYLAAKKGSGENMSCTYFAWCGLHEAPEQVPEIAWKTLAHKLIASQEAYVPPGKAVAGYPAPKGKGGGWGYSPGGEGATISSTAAAITMLTFSRERIKAKTERDTIDESVKVGFSYIENHFDQYFDPRGSSAYAAFALLDLQQFGKLTNRKLIANKDIYDTGCEILLGSPRNGNMLSTEHMKKERPYMTAACLLFLCRQ